MQAEVAAALIGVAGGLSGSVIGVLTWRAAAKANVEARHGVAVTERQAARDECWRWLERADHGATEKIRVDAMEALQAHAFDPALSEEDRTAMLGEVDRLRGVLPGGLI